MEREKKMPKVLEKAYLGLGPRQKNKWKLHFVVALE